MLWEQFTQWASTAEHLTSLQYQIEKDRDQLNEIDEKMRSAELRYEPAKEIYKTYSEIDDTGRKGTAGTKSQAEVQMPGEITPTTGLWTY